MVQEDPLVGPDGGGLLQVLAYAGRRALTAGQVLVVIDDGTTTTVRGWSGTTGPDLHGCPVRGAEDVPFDTSSDLRLDRAPDGSVRLSPQEGGSGCGLRAKTADGTSLLVLADRPQGRSRTDVDRVLQALVGAVRESLPAQRDHLERRLRGRLEEREDERRRWARELHDETLQQMGALQVLLTSTLRRASSGAHDVNRSVVDGSVANGSVVGSVANSVHGDAVLDALAQASAMLGRQITGLRHLITELRPATLDELGLHAPLHALAGRTEELTGLRVDVHVALRYAHGLIDTRLLPDIELAIYRVVQEALTNASRHADATRVRISVVESGGQVRVEVRDNGTGIHQAAKAPGFGITGMQERAELAGGRLEVLPAEPGSPRPGTLIRLVVPAAHRSAVPEPEDEPEDEPAGAGTAAGERVDREAPTAAAEQPHSRYGSAATLLPGDEDSDGRGLASPV